MMAATSYRRFLVHLYEEHLEEASFLYEQRKVLLADGSVSWLRIGEFEQRLEAHIDALVVGGEDALSVCRTRAVLGDAGELFAALCVICRQGHARAFAEILQGLDFSEAERVAAVTDSLKLELPPEWQGFVEAALMRDAGLAQVLGEVVSYRRLPLAQALRQALQLPGASPQPLLRALGRIGAREFRQDVESALRSEDSSVRTTALVSLLRFGLPNGLYGVEAVSSALDLPCWRFGLVLAGDATTSRTLQQAVKSGRGGGAELLALGALGDPGSMALLLDALDDADLGSIAALALHWMTSAPLFDEVFLPEEMTEEEMFGEEAVVEFQGRRTRLRPDGRPFGEVVRRLSGRREAWERWLREKRSPLSPGQRIRNGQPYSPRLLLDNLCEEHSDARLRSMAAQELAVRYGCPVAFEADMPVAQQAQALQRIASWVQLNEGRFIPGQWYFAAELQ